MIPFNTAPIIKKVISDLSSKIGYQENNELSVAQDRD